MVDRSGFAEMFNFADKTVCVTGAASGIGRATAILFAELGARVYVADRNEPGLRELAGRFPGRARAVLYDQARIASIEQLDQEVGDVDVLVNNAGILLYEPLLDLQWSDLERVVAINLTGSIALSRLAGARMVRRQSGVILHTSSQLVYNGAEYRPVYSATKAAITQFVKSAALEWGRHGVRVNAVAPGRTLTPLNQHLLTDPEQYADAVARIPLGRLGRPEDIANAFVFLASGAASYITGQTVVVDGGWILP